MKYIFHNLSFYFPLKYVENVQIAKRTQSEKLLLEKRKKSIGELFCRCEISGKLSGPCAGAGLPVPAEGGPGVAGGLQGGEVRPDGHQPGPVGGVRGGGGPPHCL